MSDTVQNVYSRLAAARAEFTKEANFKKVKTEELRFAYLPIEAAKPLVEKCTSAWGVTILPVGYTVVPERTFKYERQTKYGASEWWYETADVTFLIAGPEDSIELTVRGEAQDKTDSDKVVNKVYTMAYKNLVKIVFGYSEGGDDSRFADPREQDNDFNQGQEPTTARVPARKEGRPVDRFFDKGGKA